MTVYENVATSTIVNLFNSTNREEFKTQEVFKFLLKPFGKEFKYADIQAVGEQKATSKNSSIPDFYIEFGNCTKTYEVKINDAKLTKSERIKENRDVFLIPYNYKYKEDAAETGAKIIYWEDLFDKLDEKDIIIDGLDKIRQILRYPKINIAAKIWETLFCLKSFYQNVEFDFRNIVIKTGGKIDIKIPIFPNEKGKPLFILKSTKSDIKIENSIVMSLKSFKRESNCSVLAVKIYDKIYEELNNSKSKAKLRNASQFEKLREEIIQSKSSAYRELIQELRKKIGDAADDEDKTAFWLNETRYIYFCPWISKGAWGFELGFGHFGKKFSHAEIEQYGKRIDIIVKNLENIGNKTKIKNCNWILVRFQLADSCKKKKIQKFKKEICTIIKNELKMRE